MLDDETTTADDAPVEATNEGADQAPTASKKPPAKRTPAKKAATKKAPSKRTAVKKAAVTALDATPVTEQAPPQPDDQPDQPPAKKAAKKMAAKKAAAKKTARKSSPAKAEVEGSGEAALIAVAAGDVDGEAAAPPAAKKTAKKTPSKAGKSTAKKAAKQQPAGEESDAESSSVPASSVTPLFQAPDRPAVSTPGPGSEATAADSAEDGSAAESAEAAGASDDTSGEDEAGSARRRRRRGGRRRRKGATEEGAPEGEDAPASEAGSSDDVEEAGEENGEGAAGATTSSRRRRRRRRSGEGGDEAAEDATPAARGRSSRTAEDQITSLAGSTRLEAKKQRRREGREAGRRRAPIVSEAEFLARREAVDRVMVIRQRKDLTQIAVLEDKVLVEHYVARESQTSLIGNVYLGRVQNVLPSMEAAFIDIGKGRNAVLYAGEVNWDAFGAKEGGRKIEQVLKSGQSVLVQVSKDPIGHKGARLTSQISLPGRFLVYVPDGTTSGISRKLPENERGRLKSVLKQIVPDTAGVIVRTAAEGASEEELTRDVERLTARWADISSKAAKGSAPQLLYGEPDLTLKVVRDLFTEDFRKLVVSGDDAWDMVDAYVQHVAPDLAERLERYDGKGDVFAAYRIDEQIAKGLDRKVWLPSGGSLIIDRTEAMTVVDVNTGKFTGSGGNLEETVTKNNLEAAEEIVRQLRLRDIGGIIVVDFIDMVLESNRDLVLRRLVECLGRDRTRHQVAEVTSLGLVQMTRKRIGTGLLEAFSEVCEHCQGRGLIIHHEPVEPAKSNEDEHRRSRRSRGRGERDAEPVARTQPPSPKDLASLPKPVVVDEPLVALEENEPVEPEDRSASDVDPALEPTADTTEPATSSTEDAAQEPSAEPIEQPAEAMPEPVAERAIEPAPEPSSDQSLEPVPVPRVVTRVRRRSSRPAGPPAVHPNGGEPIDPAAPGTQPEADPADHPEQSKQTGNGQAVRIHVGQAEEAPEPPAAHVPIKKKGSRKR